MDTSLNAAPAVSLRDQAKFKYTARSAARADALRFAARLENVRSLPFFPSVVRRLPLARARPTDTIDKQPFAARDARPEKATDKNLGRRFALTISAKKHGSHFSQLTTVKVATCPDSASIFS
ncbi:hypothetical protein [Rhodocaloribacter sp.]